MLIRRNNVAFAGNLKIESITLHPIKWGDRNNKTK